MTDLSLCPPAAPTPPPVPLPSTSARRGRGRGTGGGIRSIAALGVADVLAGAGLRPDLIVGCSSGALFGATLAVGMDCAQALHAARTLWSQEITQQRRWRAYLQLLAPRLFGFGADFSLRDDRLIAARLERAFGTRCLETLPTPLRVAATDARSGAPILLTTGRVVDALRASMALPVIFPGVEVGGQRLVDGVVRGAATVITLGFRGLMPRRVDRPSRLFAQVSTTLINNLQEARLAAARAAGQRVIELEVAFDGRIGLWETAAMDRVVAAGRRATLAALPRITALVDTAPRVAA